MLPSTDSESPMHVVVLIPLRDDWVSASELIRRLDRTISGSPFMLDVLLVDDGSVSVCDAEMFRSDFANVRSIRILRLRRNLGHQRAIATGLVHIEQCMKWDAILVMDGDGEDTPDGALQLLRAFSESPRNSSAIFAARSRRTESFLFRVFYKFYKALHRALTGVSVRVGNFSILPPQSLRTLVAMSELWNHYAAAYFRSGMAFRTLPIPRGYRISGKSRMNFVSLVAHGMSAMSVFGEVLGVRVLIASMAGSALTALAIVAVVIIRLFTNKAIPGWATYASGTLAIIMIQFITIAITFAFTMLARRTSVSFMPLRDSPLFIAEIQDIYRNE